MKIKNLSTKEIIALFEPWLLGANDEAGYNGIRDKQSKPWCRKA